MAPLHPLSAISPQRVLFVTEPGMGHVHPLLPVMHTLQARGHAVALATSRLYQERIEREGLPFYPLGPHYSEERLEEFFPLDSVSAPALSACELRLFAHLHGLSPDPYPGTAADCPGLPAHALSWLAR